MKTRVVRRRQVLAILCFVVLAFPRPAVSEQNSPAPPAAEVPAPLASAQEAIRARYLRFENTLIQLSEYMRKSDPQRSDLLARAIGKSKEGRVPEQLETLTTLLKNDQLGDAIERQEEVIKQMQLILELLMSEDRRDEIDKEKARIRDLMKDLDKLIGKQTDARANTERGADSNELLKEQKQVIDRTQKLVQKIDDQDAAKKVIEPRQGEGKPSDDKENPNESADRKKPRKKDSKPSDGNDGKPSDSKDRKPPGSPENPAESQDRSPQKNENSHDQKPQIPQQQPAAADKRETTPGREEVEKAKQEMERAIEELKKNRKTGASDKQDLALVELQKVKEKLEQILRQLRDEERIMVLVTLEARFRDLLLRQEAVNNGTLGIHAVTTEKRSDRHRNRAVELARTEDEIALLAAKSLTLLKDEASSIAFPEAIEQIRTDMLTVARRLERVDVGQITQNIQQDIVESLREMLEAMQAELEKRKEQQQQQPQQQQQEKKSPSLVNTLAELKMLRSLQHRVNRRTKQMGRLFEGEQAVDVDVLGQLRQLSERQARVQQATHDLAAGRNE